MKVTLPCLFSCFPYRLIFYCFLISLDDLIPGCIIHVDDELEKDKGCTSRGPLLQTPPPKSVGLLGDHPRLIPVNRVPSSLRSPHREMLPPPSLETNKQTPDTANQKPVAKDCLLASVDSFIKVITSKDITTPDHSTFIPITSATGRLFKISHPNPVALFQQLSTSSVPEEKPVKKDPMLGEDRDSINTATLSNREKRSLLRRASRPIQFSKSVQSQNRKTQKTYLHFCRLMKMKAFPIECRILLAFLLWLAESGRFTAHSIDCVVFPSLCRLNIVYTGSYMDRVAQYAGRVMIASFYRDPSLKSPRGGMTPIIPDDLSRIVSAMDFRNKLSYSLAALFNFALATGARGNSCSSVRLCDLGPLYDQGDGNSVLVVRIVKLKARPNETLQISLGGNIEKECPVDVLYWLNKHLQINFKLSLRELVELNSAGGVQRKELLWPYSTDSMTQYLQSRMRAAKLNPSGFGFHSFRSGFMSSCLIQADKRGESIEDVLIRCAIITGWKPLGEVQFRYLKDAARRRIVTTNLIGTTKLKSFSLPASFEAGESNHANSYEYHIMNPIAPVQRKRSYASRVKSLLGNLLYVNTASNRANAIYISSSYSWCLRQLGMEVYRKEPDKYPGKGERGSLYRKLGFEVIDKRTEKDVDCMETIAQEMYDQLEKAGKVKAVLEEPPQPKKVPIRGAKFRRLEEGPSGIVKRKRREWSKKEDDIVISHATGEYDAEEVASLLVIRTPSDVQAHIDHLNIQRRRRKLPLLKLKPRPRGRKPGQTITTDGTVDDEEGSNDIYEEEESVCESEISKESESEEECEEDPEKNQAEESIVDDESISSSATVASHMDIVNSSVSSSTSSNSSESTAAEEEEAEEESTTDNSEECFYIGRVKPVQRRPPPLNRKSFQKRIARWEARHLTATLGSDSDNGKRKFPVAPKTSKK